jgi:hypothetical protein
MHNLALLLLLLLVLLLSLPGPVDSWLLLLQTCYFPSNLIQSGGVPERAVYPAGVTWRSPSVARDV